MEDVLGQGTRRQAAAAATDETDEVPQETQTF